MKKLMNTGLITFALLFVFSSSAFAGTIACPESGGNHQMWRAGFGYVYNAKNVHQFDGNLYQCSGCKETLTININVRKYATWNPRYKITSISTTVKTPYINSYTAGIPGYTLRN